VRFPDTRFVAQKALPIAAGVVVAAVASALLNWWLAQKAERRNPPLGQWKVFASTTWSGEQERRWCCCMVTGV
jgi:membrane protein YqaA with SNARE-associated domain